MIVAAWVLLILFVAIAAWDHAVNDGYRPTVFAVIFILTVFILSGCRAGDSTTPSEGRDSTVIHGGLGEP